MLLNTGRFSSTTNLQFNHNAQNSQHNWQKKKSIKISVVSRKNNNESVVGNSIITPLNNTKKTLKAAL